MHATETPLDITADMPPNTDAGTASAFAVDRLSNEELLARGHAIMAFPQPEPEKLYAAEIPGTIYVVQAAPVLAVKIGFTRAERPEHRLMGLQTGNPYPLKIIASATGLPKQERDLHAWLAADRLTGEWFGWSPRVAAAVDALQRGEFPHEEQIERGAQIARRGT